MASDASRAFEAVVLDNPMPASTGRVCQHPCDNRCRRGAVDAAVNMRDVHRFIADSIFHSDRFDALADSRSPKVISNFAAQAAGGLAVIGGSALSSPAMPVNRPYPLPRADQAFADVGLRLAISAPPRSLAEKVKWALRGQTYLWPAARQSADARIAR